MPLLINDNTFTTNSNAFHPVLQYTQLDASEFTFFFNNIMSDKFNATGTQTGLTTSKNFYNGTEH